MVAALAFMDVSEDCLALLWLDATLVDTSDAAPDQLSIDYGVGCHSALYFRAKISSVGSSLLTRNLRMGWAHEGAAISSTASTMTWTRATGLGGGGLESAAACWIDEVPGPTGAVPEPSSGVFGLTVAVPGPGSDVPGPASTAVFLEPSIRILVPSTGALESDPTSSGGAGTKMESDSGEGLIDGLRRR